MADEDAGFGRYEDWQPIKGETIRPPRNIEEIRQYYENNIAALEGNIAAREKEIPLAPRKFPGTLLPGSERMEPLRMLRSRFVEEDPDIQEYKFSIEQERRDMVNSTNLFNEGIIPFIMGDPSMAAPQGQEESFGYGAAAGTILPTTLETLEKKHGGLAGIADRGRYGDSILVHMAPEEVAGLASLTDNGVTINPDTGLPEMFNFQRILPALVSIGANFIPGMGPIGAAALSGVATAATSKGDDPIGEGVLAGLTTYGLGQLGSKLGTAGAQAAGTQGIGAFQGSGAAGPSAGLGSELFTPAGNIVPYQDLTPKAQAFLGQGGISNANYMEAMNPIEGSLGSPDIFSQPSRLPPPLPTVAVPALPPSAIERTLLAVAPPSAVAAPPPPLSRAWKGPTGTYPLPAAASGYGVPLNAPAEFDALIPPVSSQVPAAMTYSPQALQTAVGSGLDPLLAPSQAAAAYEAASPWEKLQNIGGGFKQVDLGSWSDAPQGQIALGDLAGPAVMGLGGLSTMFPQEEYEPPSRPSYAYQSPDARPRQRYSAPPGYIPGVSPERPYFARGGTAGRTVRGGLPTIYAQQGFSSSDQGFGPSDAEAGAVGMVDAAEASMDAWGSPADPIAVGRPLPATGYGSGNISTHDIPVPSIHSFEQGIAQAQKEDADKGWLASMFDFTVPQGRVNPNTGELTIENSINPGAVLGTIGGLATGIPVVPGMIGDRLGRNSMGLWAGNQGSSGDWGPEGEGGFESSEFDSESMRLAREAEAVADGSISDTSPTTVTIPSYQTAQYPGSSYRPGVDPMWQYYAQEGTEGMTIEENIDVQEQVEMPAGAASTAGIMQGAPMEVQGDVEARLQERPIEGPQNPRERAIYDRTVMALQGDLEPETAQGAIDEFLEVFGPDAFRVLQEMVSEESRETGGVVEPLGEETTVMEGEIQGPDVIAGKVVDPVTGEVTADLRVGENEYIEPADSLVRRATVAGLPPTPENGAMVRGEEERMLQRMVG